MAELKKEVNKTFKEFYTGETYTSNGQKKTVNCILDDNCVRYIVWLGNRMKSRREFGNEQKETCWKKANMALNKVQ